MAKDDHRPCIPMPVKQSLSHPSSDNNDDNIVMFYDQGITKGVKMEGYGDEHWKNCTQI